MAAADFLPKRERTLVLRCIEQMRGLEGVAKIVLFGSYAKGTANAQSDIDIAVFFDIKKNCLLDEYRKLVNICTDPEKEIQVQAFTLDELEDPCGIVEEIVHHGIELTA
ncbi:MAG TPA: nucleotidyltransferase domain-containing protein [Oscillospiraceae bacterium]|nr:nucleotidyltransferase domain-containing protein [Oscillospiraceae bacterium]HPF55292.1 nucleotidyltransferase domain-containing protein [Clostridiales bacterium]HPK34696.1 nucleotidyltransferase domain-containing protein [Oscillospiraceae bacterium]HPR74540.1 nucleotidyltransferase domain-containing protein [Oscillospiraceae bacterium]